MKEKVQGSWGAYLKPASFQGKLCFGPNEGRNVRFTSPASWLRAPLEIADGEEARREVTRRYLGAFGPATRADLARWWGVQPAPAGRMLEALGDELVGRRRGGPRGLDAARARPRGGRRRRRVQVARLLPGFDMWTIGAARDAAALLDPAHRKRVYRDQGWISPVLLVNGRMEGVWKHERKGQSSR